MLEVVSGLGGKWIAKNIVQPSIANDRIVRKGIISVNITYASVAPINNHAVVLARLPFQSTGRPKYAPISFEPESL